MTDPHWYVVDKRGMATCCADETDALEVARTSNLAYPQWGPHRAVRLIAVADYDRLRNALELFLAHSPEPECAIWRHVHAVARAALSGESK